MPPTQLRRRLPDAYGIQLPVEDPVFVPEPVANYWVLFMPPDQIYLHEYFGGQDLGRVHTWNNPTGFSPRGGIYDPAAQIWYGFYFDSNVGQFRVFQAVLATGGIAEWLPENVLPSTEAHEMNFRRPLIAGGTLVWMVESSEPANHKDGALLTKFIYRMFRAPLGNVAAATQVGSFEVEDIPSGTTRVGVTRDHMWVSQRELSMIHFEDFREGDTSGTTRILLRRRMLRWQLGGSLIEDVIEPTNDGGDTLASLPHPTLEFESIVGHTGLGGGASLRRGGDVAPVALWPSGSPWPGPADELALAPNGRELVASGLGNFNTHRAFRANLEGPYDQPTEVIEFNIFAAAPAWVGVKP